MPYVAFISHSSRDREVAAGIVGALEAAGLACWIAPRDVPAAAPFAGAIVQAIRRCRVLVLVLTADSAESQQVLREVQQASEAKVPILEFRSRGVRPTDDLEYYLSPNHRLEWTVPVETHLPELVEAARKLVAASGGRLSQETRSAQPRTPWFSLVLRTRRLSCSVTLLLLLVATTAILYKIFLSINYNIPFINFVNGVDTSFDRPTRTERADRAYNNGIDIINFEIMLDYGLGGHLRLPDHVPPDQEDRVDKAIESFTTAIELEPRFADAYAGRGRAWLLKGQVDLAIADFEQALALDPRLDDVRTELEKARALAKLPKLPENVFAPDRLPDDVSAPDRD